MDKTVLNDRTTFSDWALMFLVCIIMSMLWYVLYKLFNGGKIQHIEVLMSIIACLTGTLGILVGFRWGASSANKKAESIIQEIKDLKNTGPKLNIENAEQVTGPNVQQITPTEEGDANQPIGFIRHKKQ